MARNCGFALLQHQNQPICMSPVQSLQVWVIRNLHALSAADVQLPDLHTIHQATIINAFHDGIFVKIPGYEVDGLVHHSQISRQLNMDNSIPKVERYKQITGVIGEVNTQVWVKVVYVAKTEHLKCECSLKMVRPTAFICQAVPTQSGNPQGCD